MRSSVPMPGNPWPYDMVITIEDDPHALLELLWIREFWNLQPLADDLPPSLSDHAVGAVSRTESSDRVTRWQDAWPRLWRACVRHAGLEQDGAVFDRLRETADGSPERAELLRALRGPFWADEFGDEALGEEYAAWAQARFDTRARGRRLSTGEEPERVSLAALIPAWRLGLTRIVTVPCEGSYTRVAGPNALLVTEETREDPRRYAEALAGFRPDR